MGCRIAIVARKGLDDPSKPWVVSYFIRTTSDGRVKMSSSGMLDACQLDTDQDDGVL